MPKSSKPENRVKIKNPVRVIVVRIEMPLDVSSDDFDLESDVLDSCRGYGTADVISDHVEGIPT